MQKCRETTHRELESGPLVLQLQNMRSVIWASRELGETYALDTAFITAAATLTPPLQAYLDISST